VVILVVVILVVVVLVEVVDVVLVVVVLVEVVEVEVVLVVEVEVVVEVVSHVPIFTQPVLPTEQLEHDEDGFKPVPAPFQTHVNFGTHFG